MNLQESEEKIRRRGWVSMVLAVFFITSIGGLMTVFFSQSITQEFERKILLQYPPIVEKEVKEHLVGVFDLAAPEASESVLVFNRELFNLPDVVGITITDVDGITLTSTTNRIGEEHELEDITQALKQGAFYEKGEQERGKELGYEYLAEIYIPVYLDDVEPEGVVNLYFDRTSVVALVNDTQKLIALFTVFIAAFMVAIGLFTFGRQNLLIKKQSKKLAQYSRGLEVMVKDKTVDLRISEAKFRGVVEGAQDAIIIANNNLEIINWNKAAERIFGYLEREVVGRNMIDLVISEKHQQLYDENLHSFKGEGEETAVGSAVELEGRRKDGTIVPIELSLSAIKDKDAWGAVAIIRDIAERKERDEKLRELAKIVEDSHESIIITDPDGLIRYVNKAWQTLSGWSSDMIVGKKTPRVSKSGKQDAAFYKKLWKIISSNKAFQAEFVNTNKDGKEYIIDQIISPLTNDGGKISGYVGFQRDITDKVAAEEKVANLDQLKSRFITALTHVMRTPLNAIRWSVESLIAEDLGKLNAEQKNFLGKILDSEVAILRMITNMNLVLDIERGSISYKKQKTSLVSLSGSVMQNVSTECDHRQLTCNLKSPKKKIPNVSVDVERMRRVMEILVENAIYYSKAGGEIVVHFSSTASKVKFVVSDKGIGIPEGEQGYIFERFYRASNAQSMHPDGVGLGLYVAKSIVEAHDGRITFKSKEGKGSQFTVSLPI